MVRNSVSKERQINDIFISLFSLQKERKTIKDKKIKRKISYRFSKRIMTQYIYFCLVIFFIIINYFLFETAIPKQTNLFLRRRHKNKPRIFAYYLDEHGKIQNTLPLMRENASQLKQNNQTRSYNMTEIQTTPNHKKKYADPFVTDECIQQYDWQLLSYPNCNTIHEIELSYKQILNHEAGFLDDGHYRDVWYVKENMPLSNKDNAIALKTLRYRHEIDSRNFDRNRRDALAMERLTFSKYVIDIYGYCANAGLNEFSSDGTLDHRLKRAMYNKDDPMETREKIKIASDVASALSDAHNSDEIGHAAFTHGDIKPNQFLFIDGIYKLNDFNRGRLLSWNISSDEKCGYKVENNKGKNRSPEEYKYEFQDEKIDVYSMGNIFYSLLTLQSSYFDQSSADAREKIIAGERPKLNDDLLNSVDPIHIALITAMKMCHVYNKEKRAEAREVAHFLNEVKQIYG